MINRLEGEQYKRLQEKLSGELSLIKLLLNNKFFFRDFVFNYEDLIHKV